MLVSTFPSKAIARKIANSLLEEHLIACANIIPSITSLYWWEGKIIEDQEVIFFLKTAPELEEKVIQRIKELHPYDIPAIYAIPSTNLIFGPYLEWINNETINQNSNS